MNNKGQMAGVGLFIGVFITILVGLILLLGSAQNLGEARNTVALVNQSLGDADNTSAAVMTNIKAIDSAVIYNESGTEIVPANNYTITNNVVTDGALTVTVLPTTSNREYEGYEWTISGTAQEPGYIADSGARSIAGLIIIFAALAVMMVALIPTLRSKVLGL
jgi:hypothetical protein